MNPFAALKDMRSIAALLGDAERTARRMGDEQPGAEHLLLAAFAMGDGAAARAMARLGVDRDGVERAIVEEQAAGLVTAGLDAETAHRLAEPAPLTPDRGSGVYRSTVSAQELFQAAGAVARRERTRLSSAHVVLAAADVTAGTLGRVLDRLGVERPAMTAAARAELP
jgi:ATP-dependent Clp protease ATP-binding subunit ClpA